MQHKSVKLASVFAMGLLWPAAGAVAESAEVDDKPQLTSAAKAQQKRDAALRQEFPVQYQSWQQTSEQTEREDMLASYPAAVILWAGSSFAKEYNSPRGHHFAVADVTHTLRTGVPPKEGEKAYLQAAGPVKHPMQLD